MVSSENGFIVMFLSTFLPTAAAAAATTSSSDNVKQFELWSQKFRIVFEIDLIKIGRSRAADEAVAAAATHWIPARWNDSTFN